MGQNAKVCVTLNFNGRWLFDGVGWVYSGETERKNVIIEEGIDFASLIQLLRLKVGHDCSYEDWRLSYMPKREEAGHPITIGDDDDLEALKFLNWKSGEHPWPMAIYVGPVVKESLQVPQPAVGEECLSGPRNSQKVDELEVEGKPQPNPMVVDVGLYGGGGVSQSIGMSNDISVKNNVDTGFEKGDKDICEGGKGKGTEVILLVEVIGKRQDHVTKMGFGTGDMRIFEGDKGKCPKSNHMEEVIGKRQEDTTKSGFGTGEKLKSVGDKGKGPEMIQLGGVIGKSQEHAGDIGFGTGDMDILEGDRCYGLDVIHLGDTNSSPDDTVKCEGDKYKEVTNGEAGKTP